MVDYGNIETEKLLEKMEKQVDAQYVKASKEMNKKLKVYLKDYEAQNKEKQKALKAGTITQDQYDAWLKSKAQSSKWLTEMTNTLSADNVTTDAKAMSIVRGYMPEAYAINRNFAAFEVEKGALADTSFTLYDTRTVEKLIEDKPRLLPQPKPDIPKDMRWNKQKITNAITQGILQGESIPDIANRLQQVTDMDRNAAIRNGRTAVTGAQNAGRVDSYEDAKEQGIKLKQEWLATLDMRTRDSHRELDGEQVEVGGTFSNGLRYPGDPRGAPEEVYNCRCTLVAAVENVDQSDARRNSKLGNMSYEEWKKGKGKEETPQEPWYQDAVNNAEEFGPREHEDTNFNWDVWQNALSSEERNAVRDYTGSSYMYMNDVCRGNDISYKGEAFVNEIQEKIDNCESALDKMGGIAEDTKLYRGMGSFGRVASNFGVTEDDFLQMVDDSSIVGLTFTEKGFCSTAINRRDAWDKDVMLDIIAPNGTIGAYVDPISKNQGERELLLQRNTTFEILSAETNNGVVTLKVVAISNKAKKY